MLPHSQPSARQTAAPVQGVSAALPKAGTVATDGVHSHPSWTPMPWPHTQGQLPVSQKWTQHLRPLLKGPGGQRCPATPRPEGHKEWCQYRYDSPRRQQEHPVLRLGPNSPYSQWVKQNFTRWTEEGPSNPPGPVQAQGLSIPGAGESPTVIRHHLCAQPLPCDRQQPARAHSFLPTGGHRPLPTGSQPGVQAGREEWTGAEESLCCIRHNEPLAGGLRHPQDELSPQLGAELPTWNLMAPLS